MSSASCSGLFCDCFFGKPRNEGARGFLIFAISIAAAAQRLFFRRGNSGHAKQEIQNQGGRKQPKPAPGRSERKRCIAQPNHPFEEIVWMAGIGPKAGAAKLSLGRGIFLEGVELSIGQRLAENADDPDRAAEFFKGTERSARIETGEKEGKGQC